MTSLDLKDVSSEPWFDKDARVHAAIEPMEKLEAGYGLMVKIKIPMKDGIDLWLVCMSSSKLAGAWADAFALGDA
jgi:hypothetical protein